MVQSRVHYSCTANLPVPNADFPNTSAQQLPSARASRSQQQHSCFGSPRTQRRRSFASNLNVGFNAARASMQVPHKPANLHVHWSVPTLAHSTPAQISPRVTVTASTSCNKQLTALGAVHQTQQAGKPVAGHSSMSLLLCQCKLRALRCKNWSLN